MPDPNTTSYLELAKTVVYSFGGPVVIIGILAKFLGDLFAKKKVTEIEHKYEGKLEEKKAELDKAKSQFFRYSEEQFKLYNNLWQYLMMTKTFADDIWDNAEPEKLPSFSNQIEMTRKAVMDSMLLIEEEHYNDLDSLLSKFEEFEFGEVKLADIANSEQSDNSSQSVGVTKDEVVEAIKSNGQLRDDYTVLIMKIGKSFREQIRG